MGRCKNCKHWEEFSYFLFSYLAPRGFWGTCSKQGKNIQLLGIIIWSKLVFSANFGCIHFKKRGK